MTRAALAAVLALAVSATPEAAVKSVFIPEGSPAVPYTGFSGVMLRIDSVGR